MQKKIDWHEFITLCRHADDHAVLVELLDFLFTPEERDNMAARIHLVRELLKGDLTQRQIAKELDVSIAKITRGSNSLKAISDKLRAYLVQELG